MRTPHAERTNRGKAKLISLPDQQVLLRHVAGKRHAARNIVMVLLSCKAGLRAAEQAGLDWMMVCDANGRVADSLMISNHIAKYGSGRRIPCHPELRLALDALHAEQGRPRQGPVCRSERCGHMSAKAVVNWYTLQFRELGFQGCSSHSGRRSMISLAARSLAKVGGSPRDVQELAGHRSLSTTEGYIQGDRIAQRQLIELV